MAINEEVILRMAQDIGYVRGVIEPLAKANLAERVTAAEAALKSHDAEILEIQKTGRRRFNTAVAILGTVGALSSATVAILVYAAG